MPSGDVVGNLGIVGVGQADMRRNRQILAVEHAPQYRVALEVRLGPYPCTVPELGPCRRIASKAENRIRQRLAVLWRYDSAAIRHDGMQFSASVAGCNDRSATGQHASEFRGQYQIGSRGTLR